MNKKQKFLGAILVCSFFIPRIALANIDPDPYVEERKLFKKAEQLIWKAKTKDYQKIAVQLEDYPLYPYLQAQELVHNLSLKRRVEIEAFLAEHDGQPVTNKLRKKWLTYLAKRNKQSAFLVAYKPTSNAELQCHYLRFRMDDGTLDTKALNDMDKLWLHGKSQPKVCDPLFLLWRKADRRTPEMVWKRLELAATKGNTTLVPYLKTLLPEDERYLADLYLRTRRSPSYVSRAIKFPARSDKENEIATYGLKRLIWRDKELALKSYQKLNSKLAFSEEQQGEIAYSFALGLANAGHDKAEEWLDRVPDSKLSSALVQWKLTESIRNQRWQKLHDDIESLPEKYRDNEMGSYWRARSLEMLGQSVEAKKQMTELAKKRHYYGFLASAQTNQKPSMQNRPYELDPIIADSLRHNEGLIRARQFYLLERYTEARREWNYTLQGRSADERSNASRLAYEWEWFDRAIFGYANSGYFDDVEARFPLAFSKKIKRESRIHHIDAAWAFAITRRESSFMEDANSHVGALGLMQIMPATAKQLERSTVRKRDLLKASKNIELGTRYLRYLLDKNHGNTIFATASYNAGYHRVKKWKPKQTVPIDIWIETIPFKETREYVKSVMAYKQIYFELLGKDDNIFEEMMGMKVAP